jgi:rod shape-determining protein MreC
MAAESSKPVLIATLLTGGAAAALIACSSHVAPWIRPSVRDALRPAQNRLDSAVTATKSAIVDWAGDERQADDAEQRRSQSTKEIARRQLELANARLREQLQQKEQLGTSPYRGDGATPLVLPDIVTARILGEETARLWRGGLLADRGSRSELRESDLVLQDDAPLADVGADHRLEEGFPVFAGRTVFGRVQNVGRWSCTIQRVTDADFRGHAQLVRKTGRGFVFGAGGVLVGDGNDRCKLTMIPATEPVSIGDRVYTPSDAGFPYPMFYGTVEKATPGATQWEITVKPAAGDTQPRTVQILRKRFNPARNAELRLNAN